MLFENSAEEQGQQGGQQEAAAPPAAATPAPAAPKPEPVHANETEDEKTDRLNKWGYFFFYLSYVL